MTRLAIIYSIFIFTLVLAGSSAQPQGGFLDSSKDVTIRANASEEIPVGYNRPATVFPPYNIVINQISNVTLAYSDSRTTINAAYGLDTLLVLGSRLILDRNTVKPRLGVYTFNKKTSEVVDRGLLFEKQKGPTDYYCSATDPYRVYMLDYEGVLWTMQTNVGIAKKAHSSYPYDKVPTAPGYFGLTEATQPSSSADDKAHSLRLTLLSNYTDLGCYFVFPNNSALIPRQANSVVKCKLDLSGEYLIMQEKFSNTSTAAKNGTLRIVKLADLTEQIVESKGYEFVDGAWDVGYRSIVISERNYADSSRSSAFEPSIAVGGYLVYAFTFADTNTRNFVYGNNDPEGGPQRITWHNAKDGVALDQQFACGASLPSTFEYSRRNELICFKLGATPSDVLVISPNLFTSTIPIYGPEYSPEVDPSGRYLVWYTRIQRTELFEFSRLHMLLEVPYHLLIPPYTQEDMKPVDYFSGANVDVPLNFVPEVPVPDLTPNAAPSVEGASIEPWAWAVGAILLAVVLVAWIVFAIMFIRFKFRIAQRQR